MAHASEPAREPGRQGQGRRPDRGPHVRPRRGDRIAPALAIGLAALAAVAPGAFGGAIGIVGGLIVLFVGPIAVRVICELIMAIFRIHEALVKEEDR